jgi:hypothetical protein
MRLGFVLFAWSIASLTFAGVEATFYPVASPPLFNGGDAPFFFVYMAACNSGDTDHLARGLLYPYFDITGGVENMAYIGYKGKRHMVQISAEAGAIIEQLKSGVTVQQALEQVFGAETWPGQVRIYGDFFTRLSSPYTGDDRPASNWHTD